ncbi:hypothetical protein H6P81_001967 [Aristolochia fimbriata]|uniref:MHD domain-containing protein n=1 Tax=Aristolochia fimbriata TaxID=158543 RepID=A0AAV7F9Z6_ARIFI|nr:hypothetical protein H6P81_001967 [Aristolochia fimbriata]
MESKDHGESEQFGICRRLFSFFVTGMAFHRWKRFIDKRPILGEDTVEGTMTGLAQVGEANKEGTLSVLQEVNEQGTPAQVPKLVAQEESDHKNEEKEKTEEEKEKEKKEMKKEKGKVEVPAIVKDVTVKNNNNNKDGVSGSVQGPIKDAIAAPSMVAEKVAGVGAVGGSTGAVARRKTRTRTKKSVSFKDEKDDPNEAQKRKEKEERKEKQEGVPQKQAMDMNSKFQKFIDDKKQAMRLKMQLFGLNEFVITPYSQMRLRYHVAAIRCHAEAELAFPFGYSSCSFDDQNRSLEAMPGCSIRAIWILNNQPSVVFSRRFPVVEKRWRLACDREKKSWTEENLADTVLPPLPTDSELVSAFLERKEKDGSSRGFGIRLPQSVLGSDSWADDPITRHIISVCINKEEKGQNLLWPLVLHKKIHHYILVLPLVEPHHLKAYIKMRGKSDCGNSIGVEESLSSLLIDLPCITGAFMVAHALGDVISGDLVEPEVVSSLSPTVGGLLDSLTGSIGISSISARAKPVAAPVASSNTSGTAAIGSNLSDTTKSTSRPIDKDALRTFINISMPFGTPLDLNYSNVSAMKVNGFASSDLPPADLKQPAWKPYLYRGKQKMFFTIHETVYASMYDRDEIPDTISVSGQINCRAELEGLPDVSFPLTGLNAANIEVLSFHPCAQVPEQGVDKQALMFSPPLGNFVLMCYQASCGLGPPIKGFYQLSMVSEDEGAFLFKLRLMEGFKAPLTMEFCTVTMPFPRRRVVLFDGNPSIGTISTTEHSVEWKIIPSGRGITGKSIEATFPGTIRFASRPIQTLPNAVRAVQGDVLEEDSDAEPENSSNMINIEDFLMERMNKDLASVDLEEPFCWQAYNYAKVSFKIVGGTLSGMAVDPKSVGIYPTVKAPVELSMQVLSGDYLLWNTLGKCPWAVSPKVSS